MRRPLVSPSLFPALALVGCVATDDATDDEAGPSIAGRASSRCPASRSAAPSYSNSVGTAVTGTAFWNVAGDDPAVRGTVTGIVPPSGTYTIDSIQAGSAAGIQRHEVRLDHETLSGTWVFTTSDEFSVGSVVLARR